MAQNRLPNANLLYGGDNGNGYASNQESRKTPHFNNGYASNIESMKTPQFNESAFTGDERDRRS